MILSFAFLANNSAIFAVFFKRRERNDRAKSAKHKNRTVSNFQPPPGVTRNFLMHNIMNILVKLVILIMIIVFAGCRKTTTNPSTYTPITPPVNNNIPPLSYLPVYPGSFWKYKIGNDTIISLTADKQMLIGSDYCSILDMEYIHNYDKWTIDGIGYYAWVHVLSTKVGDTWEEILGDPRTYPAAKGFTVLQKTKDAHGDSIIIQKYVTWSPGPYSAPEREWVYQVYKKDVGLFFEFGIDSLTKDTTYKKTLYSFFINRNWKP